MKISRRKFWLWSVIVIGLAGGIAWYWEVQKPEEGENVAHVGWLPPEGRDIYYYRSPKFTAAEFKIDEQEFVKWCQAKGYALSPIGDEPFKILRYSLPRIQSQMQAVSQGLSEDQRVGSSEVYYDTATRVIKHGLFFRQQIGREIILLGFDRDVGVGFYESRHL